MRVKKQEFPYDIGIWANVRDAMGGSANVGLMSCHNQRLVSHPRRLLVGSGHLLLHPIAKVGGNLRQTDLKVCFSISLELDLLSYETMQTPAHHGLHLIPIAFLGQQVALTVPYPLHTHRQRRPSRHSTFASQKISNADSHFLISSGGGDSTIVTRKTTTIATRTRDQVQPMVMTRMKERNHGEMQKGSASVTLEWMRTWSSMMTMCHWQL